MVIEKSEGGGGSEKPNFLRESMKQNWKTKKQDFEVLFSNDRPTLNAARNENDASETGLNNVCACATSETNISFGIIMMNRSARRGWIKT